jgi:Mn2+/Fe2+ NRAMP family transporter
VILMLMSANRAVVGKFVLPTYLRVIGWIATVIMLLASVGFLATQFLGVR